MRMKIMGLLVLNICIGMLLVGCANAPKNLAGEKNEKDENGEQNDHYVIGLAVDQEFDSRVGVTNAIKETAEEYGIDIIEEIANGNQQTQNEQILEFVEADVDAILVCAVDQIVIEDALAVVKEADIPVVAFDRDIPHTDMVDAYVGPNSYIDGQVCGEAFIEAMKGKKSPIYVLELVGALNDQNGIDRSAGFNDAVAKNKDIVVVQMPTDWDVDSAMEATLTAFQSISDIQGVFCSTDSFMPSVNDVLKKLEKNTLVGENNHIFVNGVNGSAEGYHAVENGTADGFMVMDLDTVGITSVETALDLINGKEVERISLVESNYYTSDDLIKNMGKIWGARYNQ